MKSLKDSILDQQISLKVTHVQHHHFPLRLKVSKIDISVGYFCRALLLVYAIEGGPMFG